MTSQQKGRNTPVGLLDWHSFLIFMFLIFSKFQYCFLFLFLIKNMDLTRKFIKKDAARDAYSREKALEGRFCETLFPKKTN